MHYLFAWNQINGEAFEHLLKSPDCPSLPQLASAFPESYIKRSQMKLMSSSLVSLHLSWLCGRRIGEKGKVWPRLWGICEGIRPRLASGGPTLTSWCFGGT